MYTQYFKKIFYLFVFGVFVVQNLWAMDQEYEQLISSNGITKLPPRNIKCYINDNQRMQCILADKNWENIIDDQQQLKACAAYTVAHLLSYSSKVYIDGKKLFYEAKEKGNQSSDSGFQIGYIMSFAKNHGALGIDNKTYKFSSIHSIHDNNESKKITKIQNALQDNKVPLLFGVPTEIHVSQNKTLRFVPGEIIEFIEGEHFTAYGEKWHAITVYGYNKNGFLFKNSWGNEWLTNGTHGKVAYQFGGSAVFKYEYVKYIEVAYGLMNETSHPKLSSSSKKSNNIKNRSGCSC